ncbi:mechanosensitive ion channel family protein [Haloarcula pelagica]|uniref:mechanosensitive ion channel family protein n=1 Tax=Haloarcula pelagica TaxID=3033389 RepID=UPI0024C3F292|nr:mechanosensitive ion channel family protein [Halomicroarcula sp. YJ-61-S]
MQQAGVVQRALELLEQLSALYGPTAVTFGVLLAAFVLVVLVFPAIVQAGRHVVFSRYFAGQFDGAYGIAERIAPTSSSGVLLRTVQFTVIVSAVATVLVLWGVVDPSGSLSQIATSDLFRVGITVVLAAVGFAASDQLKRLVDRLGDGSDRITEHQEEIVLRVGQVVILLTVLSGGLTLWGENLSGLLVGAGFLGIVVGLAARQTLGSLIAGFVLMFSRPFTIGDWVELGEQEGIVTDITIFNTRLENFDGEFVVIPNDQVADQAITNRSQKGRLRLTLDVGVDYDTDIDHASEVAHEAIAGVEGVVDSPSPQIIPKSFGDSAIVLELRFWIDHPTPPRKWRAISQVVGAVKTAFDEAGIVVPFPQRRFSVREGAADTPPEQLATLAERSDTDD